MVKQSIKSGQYANPAYMVELKTTQLDETNANYLDIIGYLPESLSFNLTASWNNLLKDTLSDRFSGSGLLSKGISIAQTLTSLAGMKTAYSQISSWPTWEGTEPVEFTIPFRFDAVRDTKADVVTPWVNLLKLVCPVREDATKSVFRAPGPQLTLDPGTNQLVFDQDRVLTLKIGNFIYIKGVIVTSISNTLYSKFDINGNPIQAQADVTLRTVFSPTTTDIANWFSGNEQYDQFYSALNEVWDNFKKDPVGSLLKVSGLDSSGVKSGYQAVKKFTSGIF